MTTELPAAPAELDKLRSGFGTAARANGLPAPPARPTVQPMPTPTPTPATTQPTEQQRPLDPRNPPAAHEPSRAPALPLQMLEAFLRDPRTAVIASDPQRKAVTRRQFATYVGDDVYRTLLHMSYKDGCPTWKWLDTLVRAVAQERGIEIRAYTDEECGK